MKKQFRLSQKVKTVLFTLLGVGGAFIPRVHADSSDAVDHLLNKLEQKGVLTSTEADE